MVYSLHFKCALVKIAEFEITGTQMFDYGRDKVDLFTSSLIAFCQSK